MSICLCSALCALLYAESAAAAVEQHAVFLEPNEVAEFALNEPADALSARLPEEAEVYMQVFEHDRWSQWHLLERDTDASIYEQESQLLVTDDAQKVRFWSEESAEVLLHGITVSDAPVSHLEAAARKLSVNMIITRAEWGADESLRLSKKGGSKNIERLEDSEINVADAARYCDLRARLYPEEFKEYHAKFSNENGKALYWPQGYSKKINLFVVHHTAESQAAAAKRTGAERMRMLYAYHAVSRKWGDIGYNFVVDPDGRIYEGRAGGPYVVGAHTMCNNVNTIGIALMGNFQGAEPPDAQLQGLRLLLIQLSDEYGVDSAGRAMHHGKLYPTIIGHRDLRPTACPGGQSYALFPQIRLAVKNREVAAPLYSPIVVASQNHEATLLTGIDGPITLDMGERRNFAVKYRNVGTDTWRSGSWLLGEAKGGVYFSHFPPSSFVAGTLEEKEVPPGGIGTFTVELQGGLTNLRGTVAFTPVINNIRRLVQSGMTEDFVINPGSARFTPVVTYFPPLHTTGEDLTGTMKILNSGTVHWERDTVTELHFLIKEGKGDVSILKQPERIGPGEQGSFEVRFHDVVEEGPYSRTIVPVFGDGTPLVGSTITVASRAEPLPAIALASMSTQTLAQSIEMYRRGRVTGVIGGTTIETLMGTELTLYQSEQISIPIRIRAGENGI
ncbi:MAG: peptidoglycan recognition family protein, partial [Patescibacteria group bacterium]